MNTEPEPPVARRLFPCDVLLLDAQSNKVSLINLFDRVRPPTFPSPPKPFAVYARLTDGSGEVELRVEVETLDGLQQVYARTTQVRLPDRVGSLHVRFEVGSCSFPRSGEYQVVQYADGHPVAQTRLSVLAQESRP